MDDEIKTYSDEGKPIKMAYAVTQQRVQHYDDVIEYMTKDAIDRYIKKSKRQPSAQQIAFLKKELVRYMVIRRDIATASKIDINESNILNETYNLYSRTRINR